MVTTVTLREPFEYYTWVIVVAALFLIGALLALFFSIKMLYDRQIKQPKKAMPKIKKPLPRALKVIKDDYEKRLGDISSCYRNKSISRREAYQRLSISIRGFVSEATGIDVEHYTREEIRSFGIKSLDKLMDEYYIPEFAEDEKSASKDVVASCDKALGVIRKWN